VGKRQVVIMTPYRKVMPRTLILGRSMAKKPSAWGQKRMGGKYKGKNINILLKKKKGEGGRRRKVCTRRGSLPGRDKAECERGEHEEAKEKPCREVNRGRRGRILRGCGKTRAKKTPREGRWGK